MSETLGSGVQNLPYDDDSFDVVVNLQMLHIVEDPVAT